MSLSSPTFPTSVRLHPHGEIAFDEIPEGVKGWKQFVSEEWVDAEDSLAQRYSLMERWATADQSFRDSYHDRAITNPSPAPAILSEDSLEVNRFISLVSANKDSQPKEYVHLLKILILLYIVQDGYFYHPFSFGTAGGGQTPQIPTFITPTHENTLLSMENTLPALFLHTADFRAVGMTRCGTALFTTEHDEIWYILDETSLERGLLNVVRFRPNGSIEHATLRRPFNLTQIMIFHVGNGWSLKEIIAEGVGGRGHLNQPLDMDPPILDILQGVKDRGEFQYVGWGNREMWAREIERATPGYLQLEVEGMAGEFRLEGLAELE
ncbi:hypothetical protein BJY00DRAFT_310745 [Aspergillus carlsbadensis]|nr:hypothetical protein BJY00DRAFT_310745 [Aspergillus carlsbadensis]